MSNVFEPVMEILPRSQRALWPSLRPTVDLGFTLYGGTAIALRLGHRPSVDFDFLTEAPLDLASMTRALPFLATARTLQAEPNTWVVLANTGYGEVKVSFFGGISFGRVGDPNMTSDHVLRVASLADLMATKVKVVLQRAEAKDYRDIAAMINAGTSLSAGLAAAQLLFGPAFQPSESLKALVFYKDGDLPSLASSDRALLKRAVEAVRELPAVSLVSNSLSEHRSRPRP